MKKSVTAVLAVVLGSTLVLGVILVFPGNQETELSVSSELSPEFSEIHSPNSLEMEAEDLTVVVHTY